jgi:hypothetical protein
VRIALGLAGALAATGWLVAAGSWAMLAYAYPLPERDFVWYVFNGFAAFDPGNFAPEGEKLHSVMLAGMAVFGVGALLAMVGGAVSASKTP